jgi:hypothetical protein
LNNDFKVEMSLSAATLLLREADPGPATGAADVHATSSRAAAAATVPHASRVLRRSHPATRIAIRLLARYTVTPLRALTGRVPSQIPTTLT